MLRKPLPAPCAVLPILSARFRRSPNVHPAEQYHNNRKQYQGEHRPKPKRVAGHYGNRDGIYPPKDGGASPLQERAQAAVSTHLTSP